MCSGRQKQNLQPNIEGPQKRFFFFTLILVN